MYRCIEELIQESDDRNKGSFDSNRRSGNNARKNGKDALPYAGTQKVAKNAKGAQYSNNGAIASPLS